MAFENRRVSSKAPRRVLIDLNEQLDSLSKWIKLHGVGDSESTLWVADGECDRIVRDILLLEDRRFYRHRGFEFRSIPRALKRWKRFGRLGGVSTIEQLLVRTYLQRHERTVRRKFREVLLAHLITYRFPKSEIILAFANSAYFGPRLYGADVAARVIFHTDAMSLSEEQSGFIASLLPYPLPRNVSRDFRQGEGAVTPQEVLATYSKSNSWWVSRIAGRMSYLESLRPKY